MKYDVDICMYICILDSYSIHIHTYVCRCYKQLATDMQNKFQINTAIKRPIWIN